MHCVRFEMRLNQLLDDRREPDSDLELADHAHECPDCADLLFGHEVLGRGVELQRLDEPNAGPDLAVRVAAEVASGLQHSSWRSWIWSVSAVAAGLLLAVALWRGIGGLANSNRPEDGLIGKDDQPAAAPGMSHGYIAYSGFYTRAQELAHELRPPEWAEQMADGLKPVADSMSAALNGLRRSFTGAEPAARSSQFEFLPLARIAAIS